MHPYFAASVSWSTALADLMGYPAQAPSCGTLRLTTSRRHDAALPFRLAQLAADLEGDVVHTVFGGNEEFEPTSLLLALQHSQGIEVFDARLFCAGADRPIHLLAGGRRWFVGERSFLTSEPQPAASTCSAGEARAWRRWRDVVARPPQQPLTGAKFIHAGERYADAVPTESLNVTATA